MPEKLFSARTGQKKITETEERSQKEIIRKNILLQFDKSVLVHSPDVWIDRGTCHVFRSFSCQLVNFSLFWIKLDSPDVALAMTLWRWHSGDALQVSVFSCCSDMQLVIISNWMTSSLIVCLFPATLRKREKELSRQPSRVMRQRVQDKTSNEFSPAPFFRNCSFKFKRWNKGDSWLLSSNWAALICCVHDVHESRHRQDALIYDQNDHWFECLEWPAAHDDPHICSLHPGTWQGKTNMCEWRKQASGLQQDIFTFHIILTFLSSNTFTKKTTKIR